MKHTYLIILGAALHLSSFTQAQNTDTAVLQVKYKFTHIYDTTNPGTPYVETMRLSIGKNATSYDSYDRQVEHDRWQAGKYESVSANGTPIHGSTYSMANYIKKNNTTLYIYKAAEKNTWLADFANTVSFRYPAELSVINWQISNETKTIKNIPCQKATGACRGRTYDAWFATEIPFSAGPWKLNGLPGLIIEAVDTKKQVMFEFVDMEDVRGKQLVIAVPQKAIPTSFEKFSLIMQAFKDNPFILTKFMGAANADDIADRFMKDNAELIEKIKMNNSRKIAPVINSPLEIKD